MNTETQAAIDWLRMAIKDTDDDAEKRHLATAIAALEREGDSSDRCKHGVYRRHRCRDCEDDVDPKDVRIFALEQERDALRAENDAFKMQESGSTAGVVGLINQIADLRRQLDEAENELDICRHRLAKEEKSEAQGLLDSIGEPRGSLCDRIAALAAGRSKWRDACEVARNDLDQAREDAAHGNSYQGSIADELRARVRELEGQLDEEKARADRLWGSLDSLQEKQPALQAQLDEKRGLWEAEMGHANKWWNMARELEAQLAEERARVERMRTSLKHCRYMARDHGSRGDLLDCTLAIQQTVDRALSGSGEEGASDE